jgi:hypothetical protein
MRRVAMVGFYGGLAREWNPGSFAVGWQTVLELRARIPDVAIDLYSLDTGGEYDALRTETEDGLRVNFFCKHRARALMGETLSTYDALVVGGDNVWSTSDPGSIFFVPSESPAKVLINCVSSLRPREQILALREPIVRVCTRAQHVAVRADHLHQVLTKDFGLSNVHACPDLVLALDPGTLSVPPILGPKTKPRLGVAVSPPMVNAVIDAFERIEKKLEAFEVIVYAWTRLYQQHESVLRLRKAFGARFRYIERALSPLEAFALVGELDVSFNDTFHGSVAAIVHDKPFITTRFREPPMSRRTQLAELLGIADESIPFVGPRPGGYATHLSQIVIAGNPAPMLQPEPSRHEADVDRLAKGLERLLDHPQRASAERLASVRKTLASHFDAMAKIVAS